MIKIPKALSLIEVIISLAVITISMLGAAALFSMSMRLTRESKVRFNSAVLAKDLMEEITTKDWEDPTFPGSLGPEAGELRAGTTGLTIWDDIDDYDGLDNNPPQAIDGTVMDGTNTPYPNYSNYRRYVDVEYADETTLIVPATSSTNYKRILITIEYSRNNNFVNPDHTFTLDQIVTNTL